VREGGREGGGRGREKGVVPKVEKTEECGMGLTRDDSEDNDLRK